MARFLIEVPHGPDTESCAMAIRVFQQTGSHFLTNADWGCKDDEHKAWFIVDVDNKEEALNIVPFAMRHDAKATELIKFTMKDAEAMMAGHLTKANSQP